MFGSMFCSLLTISNGITNCALFPCSNVKQGGNIIDLLCSILVSGIGKLGDEVRRVMESCHKILNWKVRDYGEV